MYRRTFGQQGSCILRCLHRVPGHCQLLSAGTTRSVGFASVHMNCFCFLLGDVHTGAPVRCSPKLFLSKKPDRRPLKPPSSERSLDLVSFICELPIPYAEGARKLKHDHPPTANQRKNTNISNPTSMFHLFGDLYMVKKGALSQPQVQETQRTDGSCGSGGLPTVLLLELLW